MPRWINPITRWAIYVRDGATREGVPCRWCGVRTQQPSLDHLIPRKAGGTNCPTNLAASCQPCNRARGQDLHLEPMPPLQPGHRTVAAVLRVVGWQEPGWEPPELGPEHTSDGCLPWDGPFD